MSSFIGKTVQFLGLNLVILLSKIGKRAHASPKFILIWELPISIYEGFMKVPRSPIPAQRGYSHFKNHKIEKNKKHPRTGLEPRTSGL